MFLNNLYFDFNFSFLLYICGLLTDLISSDVLIILGSVVIISLPLVYLSGQAGNLIGKGFLTGLGIAGGKYVGDKIIAGVTNNPESSGASTGGNSGNSGSSDSSGSKGSDSSGSTSDNSGQNKS